MNWLDSLYCRAGCSCPLPMSIMASISHSPYILSWSPAHFRTRFLLECTGPCPSTSDICNLLHHDRECICSFRRCMNFRFLRLSSLFPLLFYLFMRATRPRTFHAGHAPSHFSCGPITSSRTFHAGQSRALTPFMRANHAPPAGHLP